MYTYILILLCLFIVNSSASPIVLPRYDIPQAIPTITPAAGEIVLPSTPEYSDSANGDLSTLDPHRPVITAPTEPHLDGRGVTIVVSGYSSSKADTVILDDQLRQQSSEKDGGIQTISWPDFIPTKILTAPADWSPTDTGPIPTQIVIAPDDKPTVTKKPAPKTTEKPATWSQGLWDAYASWYHHMTATEDLQRRTTEPVDPNTKLVSSPTKPFPSTKTFEKNLITGGGWMSDISLPRDKSLTKAIEHPKVAEEHTKAETPKSTYANPSTTAHLWNPYIDPGLTLLFISSTHPPAKRTDKTANSPPPARPTSTASPPPPPAATMGEPQSTAPKSTDANKGIPQPPPPANPTSPNTTPSLAPVPAAVPPANNPNNPMGPKAYTPLPAVGGVPSPPPDPPAPVTTTHCTTHSPPPPVSSPMGNPPPSPPAPAPAKTTTGVGVSPPPPPPPPPPAENTHQDCGCETKTAVFTTTVKPELQPPVRATGIRPVVESKERHKSENTHISIEPVTLTSKTLPVIVMVTPTATTLATVAAPPAP